MWVMEEVTESWPRAEQVTLFPFGLLWHIQHHNAGTWVTLPWQIPKAPPLNVTGSPRQRNMAQMKEQIKTLKIELSHEEITNLSDAQFKTLVIRMLTEMVESGHKIEEKVKAMQSEMKKNIQGINSEGKKSMVSLKELKSTIWSRKKK